MAFAGPWHEGCAYARAGRVRVMPWSDDASVPGYGVDVVARQRVAQNGPGDETRVRDQGVQQARVTPRETNLIARNSVPASAEPVEDVMEFLVEVDINGPDGTPGTEVADRQTAEASGAPIRTTRRRSLDE